MYAEDVFAVPVNLAGIPGVSVPCGNVVRDDVQLPVGFQIVAAHGNDNLLFKIGTDVENRAL